MPPCDGDGPDANPTGISARILSLWVLIVAITYAGTVIRCKAPGLAARLIPWNARK